MYIYTNILVFHEMLWQLWRLPVAQLYSLNEPTTTNSPFPPKNMAPLSDNTTTQTSCDVMATGYECCWDGITSGIVLPTYFHSKISTYVSCVPAPLPKLFILQWE